MVVGHLFYDFFAIFLTPPSHRVWFSALLRHRELWGGAPFISLPGNEGPVAPFVVRWAGAVVAEAGEGWPLFLTAEWASVPTDLGGHRGPRPPKQDSDEVMFRGAEGPHTCNVHESLGPKFNRQTNMNPYRCYKVSLRQTLDSENQN